MRNVARTDMRHDGGRNGMAKRWIGNRCRRGEKHERLQLRDREDARIPMIGRQCSVFRPPGKTSQCGATPTCSPGQMRRD